MNPRERAGGPSPFQMSPWNSEAKPQTRSNHERFDGDQFTGKSEPELRLEC